MPHLFVHGVPDTPAMWGPLLDALDLPPAEVRTPAMPGFVEAPPADFAATKDAYADWLVDRIDTLHAEHGPIDLVGHDWGALLTLRAASLRPEKLRTWAALNGGFDPRYGGHLIARIWNRPVLGEALMALNRGFTARLTLRAFGMPADMAAREAAHIGPTMKRCILKLYRSAGGLADLDAWTADLDRAHDRGLLVWGDRDPFLPVALAERLSTRLGVPLHVERGAGHWTPVVRPDAVAAKLRALWGVAG